MRTSDSSLNQAHVAAVKRSPQYRLIHSRIAHVCPSDGWYEDGVVYVVFDLRSAPTKATGSDAKTGTVIFALIAASVELIAARTVEPNVNGEGMIVHDLLAPNH